MHQRRRVEPGHAARLRQTAAREALDVGIQRRKQRAHRLGITGGGALNEKGRRGGHHRILQWNLHAAAGRYSFSLKRRFYQG